MAWITDSLRGAIEAVGRFNPFGGNATATALPGLFTHELAIAAYMSSGMMRKVITIPAEDRVREWRDWQTAKENIEALEAEEARLGLLAKVKQAEVLRGMGGGALILVTKGPIGTDYHATELKPETVRKGDLVAINVVSRWEIKPQDFVKELADPEYRKPRSFTVNGGERNQAKIHPSRVIPFRGDPIPAGTAVDDVENFWGDCRLLRVYTEVQRSDDTQAWFASLVRKAKLLRIGIPDLLDMMSSDEGKKQLDARVALIAQGESTLNATVYRSGTGADDPGEKLDDYQINWAGIPAVMDAFDQRVAAVSDIPFTRLMGRSPAGMNATGKSDDDNWNKMVVAGQKLELRPCLDALDPILIRSAGVDPNQTDPKSGKPIAVTWKFAPLSVPSEAEEATTFKTTMEAVTALQATNAIPNEAFAKGVQNLMSEREYIPGLDQALAEIPEAERFGLNPDDDGTDPSAIQSEGGDPASAGGGTQEPARRAANDGKPAEGE